MWGARVIIPVSLAGTPATQKPVPGSAVRAVLKPTIRDTVLVLAAGIEYAKLCSRKWIILLKPFILFFFFLSTAWKALESRILLYCSSRGDGRNSQIYFRFCPSLLPEEDTGPRRSRARVSPCEDTEGVNYRFANGASLRLCLQNKRRAHTPRHWQDHGLAGVTFYLCHTKLPSFWSNLLQKNLQQSFLKRLWKTGSWRQSMDRRTTARGGRLLTPHAPGGLTIWKLHLRGAHGGHVEGGLLWQPRNDGEWGRRPWTGLNWGISRISQAGVSAATAPDKPARTPNPPDSTLGR